MSGLIGAIYDRMNEDLDDVLKLEINYVGGVIHRYVMIRQQSCASVAVGGGVG